MTDSQKDKEKAREEIAKNCPVCGWKIINISNSGGDSAERLICPRCTIASLERENEEFAIKVSDRDALWKRVAELEANEGELSAKIVRLERENEELKAWKEKACQIVPHNFSAPMCQEDDCKLDHCGECFDRFIKEAIADGNKKSSDHR